ncbi:helix-turn-helix transcriptional regulator [Dokdonella sp.]|uniref:helix-turn-helix transcriptional regulator n=1 Tax=Dokdonella sp. TaxID=2291710 RepID=UPI003783F181
MTEQPTTDPFFEALAAAPRPLLLTEKDVAALLQCSVRLLQQWRAEGVQPPLWITLGSKLVRYPAQALVEWASTLAGGQQPSRAAALPTTAPPTPVLTAGEVSGLDEPLFRGGRRRSKHASFDSFLMTGLPRDEWLFRRCEGKRPQDFLASLDEERSDADDVQWLRLDAFLDSVRRCAETDAARNHHDSLEMDLGSATAQGRLRRLSPGS